MPADARWANCFELMAEVIDVSAVESPHAKK
jgi:hypothetical protein